MGTYFQPSLMFAVKAEACLSGAIFGYDLCLTCEYYALLENLCRYKHSSLFCVNINEDKGKFIKLIASV